MITKEELVEPHTDYVIETGHEKAIELSSKY